MAGVFKGDYAAISADYRAGLGQAEIAARHGVHKWTVCRAVRHCIPAAERERLRKARLKAGALVSSQRRQADKIERGEFTIREEGGVLKVLAKGVEFTFDLAAAPLLRRFPWRVTRDKRLLRQVCDPDGRIKNIYVYHDILDVAPSRALVVDHINRAPTDNRRSNLRLCTYSENALNRGPRIKHAGAHSMSEEHDCA